MTDRQFHRKFRSIAMQGVYFDKLINDAARYPSSENALSPPGGTSRNCWGIIVSANSWLNCFTSCQTKHFFRTQIPVSDYSICVHDNYSTQGGIENRTYACFAFTNPMVCFSICVSIWLKALVNNPSSFSPTFLPERNNPVDGNYFCRFR